jgi:hypothetical protein
VLDHFVGWTLNIIDLVAQKMVVAELTGFFYYFAFGSNLLDERIHVQVKNG